MGTRKERGKKDVTGTQGSVVSSDHRERMRGDSKGN